MQVTAYRGAAADRPTGLPLPPARAPMLRHWRLHKGWRYVGVWSPTVSVCAARVQVGPVRQEFWGVWDRSAGRLSEHTRLLAGRVHLSPGAVRVRDGDAHLDLVLAEDDATAFEVVTPVGRSWTWTRKQAVRALGTAVLDGRRLPVDGVALIDDNDGFHPRRTHWWWSGGTAVLGDGRTATWSVIVGLNDQPPHTENTLWLDGRPQPLGPVTFAPDLSRVSFDDGTALDFTAESERASRVNLLGIRSAYRQPFGTFAGTLPGGLVVRQGYGVMEDHQALW
ncbi:MAG: hypothetical protein AVDCRST_MAG61-645 [uncultured Friedmanniella sp.]|uniref:DUF2804 family protein n=1 Tax=uncultured Friedmanniella sp. TaxID=335381 RepID=A0A6J4K447_9ACTN|nr:DUF2804 family protein [uncultured Friedmanniella sp.]CAA9295206.1 MAG: hypothetical protein AVDCRST_MAG61-645 [uncultured Friedmanniella sp.]